MTAGTSKMRTFQALGLVALLMLPGCAGSVVGDAIKGPEKLAQEDDAYCRSIGAVGQDYTNCRLLMTQRRDNKHAIAIDRQGGSGRPAIQCTTMGTGLAVTTTCN